MNLLWLGVSIGGFGAAVAAHAIFTRLNAGCNRVLTFTLVAAVTGILVIALLVLREPLVPLEVVAGIFVYAFACELYIFLFTMTVSSISSNVLVQLACNSATVDDVMLRYDSEHMVRMRLQRMQASGFLFVRNGQIALTKRGARLNKAFEILRRLFRHSAIEA
jgi:hypothetical protein